MTMKTLHLKALLPQTPSSNPGGVATAPPVRKHRSHSNERNLRYRTKRRSDGKIRRLHLRLSRQKARPNGKEHRKATTPRRLSRPTRRETRWRSINSRKLRKI